MAAKDSARGKAFELYVGRLFGGRRRRNGEGVGFDDCVDENGFELPISIECKAYSVVQLKTKWFDQAKRNGNTRPWIIAQRPKGWRRPIATVDLLWLRDVCAKAGVIPPPPTTPEEITNGDAADS